MPYLYYHAIQGHLKGHPVQRAMWLDFVQDRTTHYLDRQFMLGPSLLVAPVFVPYTEESEYYLPHGKWTSFWSNRTIQGPSWVSERVSLEDIPVWVRPASIILLGPTGTNRPDYDYRKKLTVRIYELNEGQTAEASIPTGHGVELAGVICAKREFGELKIWTEDSAITMASIELYFSEFKPKRAIGATPRGDNQFEVAAGATEIRISL